MLSSSLSSSSSAAVAVDFFFTILDPRLVRFRAGVGELYDSSSSSSSSSVGGNSPTQSSSFDESIYEARLLFDVHVRFGRPAAGAAAGIETEVGTGIEAGTIAGAISLTGTTGANRKYSIAIEGRSSLSTRAY